MNPFLPFCSGVFYVYFNTKEEMKIAYVTTRDPEDIHAWSGSVNNIRNALSLAGLDVVNFGNIKAKKPKLLSYKKRAYNRLFHCKYHDDRHTIVLKSYGDTIKQKIQNQSIKAVFSHSSILISDLKIKQPIIFWTDATFAGMVDFYPSFTGLCKETIRCGNRQEKMALKNCSLAIYASEWAANTAIKFYNANLEKVKVVPFGANIVCDRTENDIITLVEKKINFSPLKLLFVGKDWERKGGDKALEVAELLNSRGVQVEFHIVGCIPERDLPDFAVVHGFISKKTLEGRAKLDQLFSEAHFFILPSIAEAYGIVFAEASSFGLPSLASNVGGITTAIRNGFNGFNFSIDDSAESYCEAINNIISSEEKYKKLALSSFNEYKTRLNWEVSGRTVRNLLTQYCN